MSLIEFGTIMNLTKGKKPKNQFGEYKAGLMPYVDIKAFETGRIESYTDGEKCLPCKEGDILIVCDGSRSGLVGKALNGYVGSTLAKISAEGLTQDYLYYFLQGQYALLNTKKKGTGTPHLNPELLRKQLIYVPSIEMQQRIVFRIEELFSELDKGVETLQTIKGQLAVYQQTVLKNIFENIVDTTRLDTVAFMIDPQPSHRTPPETVDGISYIGIGDIDYAANRIDFASSRKVSPDVLKEHLLRYTLHDGDFVMGKIGTIGNPFRVVLPQDYALSANVILIQPNKQVIDPNYLF